MRPRGTSWARGASVLALAALLPACVSTIPLDPGAEFVPPSPLRVPLTVGVYYSPELRAYTFEVRQGAMDKLLFPVGHATVRLLDALNPSVFARTVPLDSRPPLSATAPSVDAVLEPAIERVNLSSGPFVAQRVLLWAELTYRFTVQAPTREQPESWTVTGSGEATAGAGQSFDKAAATAMERAMRDAGQKWLTSFFYIPEARRWARGLPAAGSTAPEDGQTTTTEGLRVRASYADMVAVECVFDATTPGVLTAKLRITNEGPRKLFVRPDDVALRVGQEQIRAAPASALATALTSGVGRVPAAPPFAGVGTTGIRAMGAANLVGALINLALARSEQRTFEAALLRYRQEDLRDVTLWAEESMEFAAYFLLPGVVGGTEQSLVLPVVDIDRAVRYVVQVPVPKDGRSSP
jgi:hypothetical protein